MTASSPRTFESVRCSASSPVSTRTPKKPSASPAPLIAEKRSSAKTAAAKMAVKMGIVEFSTAAMPLSMCSSPQAISANGTTLLMAAIGRVSTNAAGVSRSSWRLMATKATTQTAPIKRRPATNSSAVVSSTITLINRNDAPQTTPRASSTVSARASWVPSLIPPS